MYMCSTYVFMEEYPCVIIVLLVIVYVYSVDLL